MIRLFIFLGIASILMVVACKRTSIEKNGEIQPQQSFGELKTAGQFNWNTNSELTLLFLGKNNDPRIAALKLIDNNGRVYFQRLQRAKENFQTKILIPSHVQNLRWSFAGQFQNFNPKTGRIVVSLQP